VTFWVGRLDEVIEAVIAVGASAGARPGITGPAGAGALYACLDPGTEPETAARFAGALRDQLGGSTDSRGPRAGVVVMTGPEPVMAAAGTDGRYGAVPGATLMRAIKDQFDPDHRLFPGRLAGL